MEKLTLIILLTISLTTKAENIIQFRPGNYAFAENGKLTFNLEPSLYENRSWKYDEKTKQFKTQFKTSKIKLKTKYSSQFHFYNSTYVAYQQNIKNGYFVHPALNNQTSFYNQKTFWPAIDWLVRVGGTIAAEVVPPIITRCLTNTACATGVALAAAYVCPVSYVFSLTKTMKAFVPASVCAKVEEEGYDKDENGNYSKEVNYRSSYVDSYKGGNPVYVTKEFKDLDSAIELLKKKVKWREELAGTTCEIPEVKQESDREWTVKCGYSLEKIYKMQKTSKQDLMMIDLENFVFDDMKKNPTPYINSKSDLGKELRESIKANQADTALNAIKDGKDPDLTLNPANGSGMFTAVSDPYRDENGETKQDIVTISAPTSSSNGSLSGSIGQGSSGGSGVSVTKNNVSVSQKARPDKEGEAEAGENNSKDGNSSGGSSGNSNSSSNDGSDDKEQGEQAKNICETNPDSIACMKAGSLENEGSNPFSDALKTVQEDGTKFGEQNILPKYGICPAPNQFNVFGKTYELSYYWLCQFAKKIRALIIGLAAIAAGFIIFSARKD